MALETLRSSCPRFGGKRLWLGKAVLMSRQVLITGWQGVSRFRERVPLSEVTDVSRLSASEEGNLLLTLRDGTQRRLQVSAPGIWRGQIEYRLRRMDPNQPPQEASALPAPALPTADELEQAEPRSARESLDSQFFDSELGTMPAFHDDGPTPIGFVIPEEEDQWAESIPLLGIDPEEERARAMGPEPTPTYTEDGTTPVISETGADTTLPPQSPTGATPAVMPTSNEVAADSEPVIEIVGLARPAGEAEVPAPAHAPALPGEEGLHEIGDDAVRDSTMDASTVERVVQNWLDAEGALDRHRRDVYSEAGDDARPAESPVVMAGDEAVSAEFGQEAGEARGEPRKEVTAESRAAARVEPREEVLAEHHAAVEPLLEDSDVVSEALAGYPEEAPVAMIHEEPVSRPPAESTVQVPRAATDSSPFHIKRVYERGVAETVDLPPRRQRQPIRSMAELRPMSLADIIAQSQPSWTALADLE